MAIHTQQLENCAQKLDKHRCCRNFASIIAVAQDILCYNLQQVHNWNQEFWLYMCVTLVCKLVDGHACEKTVIAVY